MIQSVPGGYADHEISVDDHGEFGKMWGRCNFKIIIYYSFSLRSQFSTLPYPSRRIGTSKRYSIINEIIKVVREEPLV